MGAVELSDVTFRYASAESNAVDGVSFTVEPGKLCALVGANGSGKTTLCNIIRGFAPHFFTGDLTGEVVVQGQRIGESQPGDLATLIGFVFQNPFVQISGSKDTVYEEVAFGLENLGVPLEEIHRRVETTLAGVGIEALRDNNPLELSGGQKQRVALASTLAMDPPVFVIDEPTSQLDPQGTEDVFDIITLLKNEGKTIVLVEHKMELIARYADQVVVLDHGRVVLNGPTDQVLADPDLAGYHVAYPEYARVGHALREAGIAVPKIPVTREATLALCDAIREGV